MVTAKEYRELSVQYHRWADEAEARDVRDVYLRLADQWTVAALVANSFSASTSGIHAFSPTRH
jgi:hypothetical protein